jgi:hypothetical protein
MKTKSKIVWVLKRFDTNENFGIFTCYENAENVMNKYPDEQTKRMIIVDVELDRAVSF